MLDKMSDASRIVEKLVAKQLVERYTDEQDRRKCKVHITEKGLELLAAIDKREPEFYNFFSAITEEEAATINALLDKLRD
jgi:DNA-binding MarR family transcriptional regulator